MSELPKSGALYNNITGRIDGRYNCSNNSTLLLQLQGQPSSVSLYQGIVTGMKYINVINDPVTLEERTEHPADFDKLNITADGVDYATLSPLINPTVIRIGKEEYIVTDGSFEFDTLDAGEYSIIVDEVTTLRKEWIINAS